MNKDRRTGAGKSSLEVKRHHMAVEPGDESILFADSQPLDNASIAANVFLLQVVQQSAPLANHLQQAATRMMVFAVGLEVLREVGNALAQNRNLHLRRARVRTVKLIVSN